MPQEWRYCMDAHRSPEHHTPVRVLPHIKKLDDALGDFLVQITCKCGARRIAEPEALARLCGSSATLQAVGLRMRCSRCARKAAETVAVANSRPQGVPKKPR
jgi:hypothetical protein